MADRAKAARAAQIIGQVMRKDEDLRAAMKAVLMRTGYENVLQWAEAHQSEAILVAEAYIDMENQTAGIERYLAAGKNRQRHGQA